MKILAIFTIVVVILSLWTSAIEALRYPGDCNSSKMRRYATGCGMQVISGGKHYLVNKNGRRITTIPRTVKANGTCRNIINELNNNC